MFIFHALILHFHIYLQSYDDDFGDDYDELGYEDYDSTYTTQPQRYVI